MDRSSLKEYYIKIQELYNNAVNMLTAIQQSFNSNSSEINVNFIDTNNISQNIRIPSFLYLENKIEQIDSNLSSLMNIPKSGEAWFNNNMSMHKIQLVKSTTAPIVPTIDTDNISAYVKDNNILRDMVNPKTYLKIDLTNIPDNIEKIFLKKIIINDIELYESVVSSNLTSYEEYVAFLANLSKGKEYDEYDTEISMPLKRDAYKSSFKIIDVPTAEENPYKNEVGNLVYKLIIDTATYSDEDDSANTFMLHKGQYLTLDNDYVIYKVLSVNTTKINDVVNHEVILEEIIGHIYLQTFEENSGMVLHLYNISFDNYHYIEVPTEENQFVVIFLATIYNNVRSNLSAPLLFNMNEIYMKDQYGNPILYNGKEISYIEYYNTYCKNIGDLILGISEVSYPQLSNYSVNDLKNLQDGPDIQSLISNTINTDNLKVQRINTHLIDDEYSNQLVNLHAKKAELNAQLNSIQENINESYNELVNSSSTYSITEKESIKEKLDTYYTERIKLQKEVISVVENINILKTNVYGTAEGKYRIRGNATTNILEEYIQNNFLNCKIIGLQYEYKYKSIISDTTNVTNINSTIFTEWNRVTNTDKERKLSFNTINNTYNIINVEYDPTQNVVKWNQIDIPITQGEDVVLRVRFKYSIGQPFIDLYTPWSDELTIKFPLEFNDPLELTSIVEQNNSDYTTALFDKTLINQGYSEHISNKIIDNSQIFYHMPENIYSGFNTPENKYLSLKEKLQELTNDIDKYKELFEFNALSTFDVYVEWEGNSIKLLKNSTNNISLNETVNVELINTTYTTKIMNLVIRNTGTVPLKLYSILPGDITKELYKVNNDIYANFISDYESVPLLKGAVEENDINNCLYIQKLGQWIYFRKNNPYTLTNYYNNNDQNESDITTVNNNIKGETFKFNYNTNKKFNINGNTQMSLPYRMRTLSQYLSSLSSILSLLGDNNKSINENISQTVIEKYEKINKYYTNLYPSDFTYNTQTILKFENIKLENTSNSVPVYLTSLDIEQSISKLYNKEHKNYIIENFNETIESMTGAFLIPNLFEENLLLCDNNQYYKQINVGDFITIPILFEYYIDNNGANVTNGSNSISNNITKYLNFDIKNSLGSDIIHYELSVTVNYQNYIISTSEIDVSNQNDLIN